MRREIKLKETKENTQRRHVSFLFDPSNTGLFSQKRDMKPSSVVSESSVKMLTLLHYDGLFPF